MNIETTIFETLICNYCTVDKTNELVVLSTDNIGLYIAIWYKNKHYSAAQEYSKTFIHTLSQGVGFDTYI